MRTTSTESLSKPISALAFSLAFPLRAMLYADVLFSLMAGSSRAMATSAACASSRGAAAFRPSFTSPMIMSSTRCVRYERLL